MKSREEEMLQLVALVKLQNYNTLVNYEVCVVRASAKNSAQVSKLSKSNEPNAQQWSS